MGPDDSGGTSTETVKGIPFAAIIPVSESGSTPTGGNGGSGAGNGSGGNNGAVGLIPGKMMGVVFAGLMLGVAVVLV